MKLILFLPKLFLWVCLGVCALVFFPFGLLRKTR